MIMIIGSESSLGPGLSICRRSDFHLVRWSVGNDDDIDNCNDIENDNGSDTLRSCYPTTYNHGPY